MTTKTAKTVKSDDIRPISGETSEIALSELRLLTRNPRKGNVGVIAASLVAHGQYRPVVANIGSHTGRPHEVLAGNHTVQAFRLLAKKHPDDLRWRRILVHWVDLDHEQALRVVLADNKTAEGGGYDKPTLAGLIADVSHDYGGLGWTETDLARLEPAADDLDPDALVNYEEPGSPDDGENEAPTHPGGRGEAVIAYTVVFDDADQRKAWMEFVTWLKRTDPDSTPAERLTGYLEKLLGREVQEDEKL